MKKIMFNDLYGLTAAVLEGRKTMTRRVITGCKSDSLPYGGVDGTKHFVVSTNDGVFKSTYKVDEIVAVAQAYGSNDFCKHIPNLHSVKIGTEAEAAIIGNYMSMKGWNNKMFVKPDLMPHRIRITDIKVERLQDISDEDCLKEGIDYIGGYSESYYLGHGCGNIRLGNSPRDAFAHLIDKVSKKGTWERNPWVFVYTFELIK